jgi:hypothetical protein
MTITIIFKEPTRERLRKYRYGGLKKVWIDDYYLYTTIYDTERRRLCDIESFTVEETIY